MMVETERAVELSVIEEGYLAGGGSALILRGDRGSGRSRLLKAATKRIGDAAVLVQTNPAESHWPFSGISAIAAALGALDLSAEKTLSGLNRATRDGTGEPFQIAVEFIDYLRDTAHSPRAVFIDDLESMDASSRMALTSVVRRLAGTRLFVVIAATSGEDQWDFHGLPALRLGPLSLAASMRVAHQRVGRNADSGVIRILAVRSSGNPGTLVQALSLLRPGQLSGREPLVLPADTTPVSLPHISRALAKITEQQREILNFMSASYLISTDILREVVGASTGDIAELIAMQVISQGQQSNSLLKMVDPRVRDWLYNSLELEHRLSIHRSLSTVSVPLSDEFRLWHATFLSRQDEDLSKLLAVAVSLCKRELNDLATEIAERVLRLVDSHGSLVGELERLARAFMVLGELDLAHRYLDFARRSKPERETALRLQILFAELCHVASKEAESYALSEMVSAEDWLIPDTAVRVLSSAALMHAQHYDLLEAKKLLDQIRPFQQASALNAGPEFLRARLLTDAISGYSTVVLKQFEEISRQGFDAMDTLSVLVVAQALTAAGFHSRARSLFVRILSRFPVIEPLWHQSALIYASINELDSHSYGRASKMVQKLLDEYPDSPVLRCERSFLTTWFDLHRREESGLGSSPIAVPSVGEADGTPYYVARRSAIVGRRLLADRDANDAIVYLRKAMQFGQATMTMPLATAQADLIEALLLVGDRSEAQRQADELDAWLLRQGSAKARAIQGFIRSLTVRGERWIPAVENALQMSSSAETRYENARVMLAFGRGLQLQGKTQDARRHFRNAELQFTDIGAADWAASSKAYSQIAALPPATPRSDTSPLHSQLTPEEENVVALVLQGFKNREIAEALFVSVRTVEVRLTRIYRKVGARSKTHLATLLSGGHEA